MTLVKLRSSLQDLFSSLESARAAGINRIDDLPEKTQTPYQQARHQAVCASVSTAKSRFARVAQKLIDDPLVEHEVASALKKFTHDLQDVGDVSAITSLAHDVASFFAELPEDSGSVDASFVLPQHTPSDILPELEADAHELRSCLKAQCYRSVVILAGRMLETALHRKYYEATGNDLLEKAPGIGLGSLIAKLSEKNVSLDPGLRNQVHLINSVRVFSVHKKQQPFSPSAAQAQAIALYTFDVLSKLF